MRSIAFIYLALFLGSCNLPIEKIDIQEVVPEKELKTYQIPEEEGETLFECYDGSQQEMNICSRNEYLYYDSILNEKYSKLLEVLNAKLDRQSSYEYKFEYEATKEYINKITQSEKDWIKLKLSNAEVTGSYFEEGTMGPLIVNHQLIIDTKDRIVFIEHLLEGEI